jgi:hypothetical protein
MQAHLFRCRLAYVQKSAQLKTKISQAPEMRNIELATACAGIIWLQSQAPQLWTA